MKIQVRDEHIRAGVKSKGDACPVYLAMRDAGLRVTFVAPVSGYTFEDKKVIDIARIGGISWSSLKMYKFPDQVRYWIVDFDDGKDMEPIEFEITDVTA